MAPSRARHAAAGALVVAVAWLVFYAGWLWRTPGGDRALLVFSDTAYVVPIVAAALLCGWAATRVPRELRAFWILIGLGCVSWAAGEVLWSVRELGTGSVPYPWWTDACYLGFYGFALVGLGAFFRPSLRLVGIEGLLDGALAIASLGLLWWWLVLRDVDVAADLPSLVGLSYPVLDLLLLCVVALTPLVAARRGTLAGWLVALGIVAGGVSDGIYTRLVLHDDYASGMWIDLGWQVQACSISLAAVAAALGIGRRPNWSQRRSPLRVRSGVSMTAALVVVLAVLVADGASGTLTRETVLLVFGVAALLTARGWMLLLAVARESTRRDPVTGVYEEPHLHDQLRRLAAAARQYSEPFALVLIKVPRRSAAEALRSLVGTARELDLVAQLEDGRLAVALPRTVEAGAADAAERLRAAAGGSAGVAVWRPGDTAADVVAAAGQLLAAAIRLGGNHTRGPEADVLVDGEPPLGATAFLQLLQLARAVDARYRIAPAHSPKVARLSRDLALELELDADAVAASYLGGLLHALGTLRIDEVHRRPQSVFAALDAKLELRHGPRGADLVRRIPCAAHVAPLVASYEEHWDGSGPRRLRGESIPFGARVIAVANAITTMTEPGGDALPLTSALSEIWRLAGGRYDPEVVSALFRLVKDGRIAEALQEDEPRSSEAVSV
ncbi:MAG TPA: HD domain-containing phosphohydrolase [Gaiellaceae bacterium]|nr:HD domain-containing phosphohydrolase [Gaiellaceae bacterium]